MTTHEQQERVAENYDETRNPTAATSPETLPADTAQPQVAPNAPAPVGQEQFRDTPAPVAGHEENPVTDQEQWQPPAEPVAQETAAQHHGSATEEVLFAEDDLTELRGRWAAVQAAFVDDPKDCVQKADVLVSDLVDQLTSGFAQARSRLEEQWAQGQEASTEDLRLALMHYREFFERLLSV